MRIVLLSCIAVLMATQGLAAKKFGKVFDYKEIERVALEALGELQLRSFKQGVEYCGWILDDGGVIIKGEARRGNVDSCNLPRTPRGAVAVASYHTHGRHDRNYFSEVPSELDVEGDFEDDLYGFVSTPGGRVWLVDPIQEEIFQICGEACLDVDPRYNPKDVGHVPQEFTLDTLVDYLGD